MIFKDQQSYLNWLKGWEKRLNASNKTIYLDLDENKKKLREITKDGPITNKYFAQKLKIMWVLKEPDGGGGESLIDYVQRREEPYKDRFLDRPGIRRKRGWHATYGPIIRVTYLLLNDGNRANDIFTVNGLTMGSPQVFEDCLDQIAIINLNKFGGGPIESTWMNEGAELCSGLVDEQLKRLAPDIVICGHTLGTLVINQVDGLDVLQGKEYSPKPNNFPGFQNQSGRIYISAYHPCRSGGIRPGKYYNNVNRARKGAVPV